jgi:transcription antitermination factor NusG
LTINTEKKWYALYTKSRAEKKANIELQQLGIETYLPLRKELRQWSDRKKWIESPVISSYIFVHIIQQEYRKVFDVRNIVAFVSYKGKAVSIPDREIEAMQRVVENKISFSVEKGDLKKGKNITFVSGPLIGITGEITDIQGQKKLFIRIKHAGFSLVVNLEKDTVYQIDK